MDAVRNLVRLDDAEWQQEQASRSRMRQRRSAIRRETDLMDDMSRTDFIKLYRLPQATVRSLVEDIRNDMQQTTYQNAVTIEAKVLCALSFFATGSYQRAVGQDFNVPLSQPMVSRSVFEVATAINNRLLHEWIKFPLEHTERQHIKERFYAASGMPGVIGAIDCTHISIVRPNVHEEHYINRKGYHSLNVQAISDYDMRFLNINARYPGATGDAFIWRNSTIKQELVRRYNAGQRGEWLIGDSGYANEPWLLLPVLHAEPNTPEETYTTVHCRARNCVERSFGLLKARWRCLLRHRCLHYSPERAALIVNACAVLHNMALDAHLPDPEPINEEEAAEEMALEAGDNDPNAMGIEVNFLGLARAVREQVIQRVWLQHRPRV